MPPVTVRLYAGAAAAAGCKEVVLEATDLSELCSVMVVGFGPQFDRVLAGCSILINGTASHRHAAGLQANDTVDVLPPFAGG